MKTLIHPTRPAACWPRPATALVALIAVAHLALSPSRAWAGTDSEQAVLSAHEARRTATLGGDVARLGSLMSDDLTFTHANAVVETKAEFLAAIRTGRYRYKSLTDEERRIRVHGDAGVVSGTCRILVAAGGKDIDIRVSFTEVWVREKDAWRMVLWHATQMP